MTIALNFRHNGLTTNLDLVSKKYHPLRSTPKANQCRAKLSDDKEAFRPYLQERDILPKKIFKIHATSCEPEADALGSSLGLAKVPLTQEGPVVSVVTPVRQLPR